MTGNFIPDADDARSLGNPNARWKLVASTISDGVTEMPLGDLMAGGGGGGSGPPGPPGLPGIQGPQGDPGPAGVAGINYRGDFASGQTYNKNDVVRAPDGHAYFAMQDGLTAAPPSAGWAMFVMQGAPGIQGPQGDPGQNGQQGNPGLDGPPGNDAGGANILVNTDFAHTIDQRGMLGAALGSSVTYAIDRWASRLGTLTQEAGCLRHTASSTSAAADITQKVESWQRYAGKTVTLSARLRSSFELRVHVWDGVDANSPLVVPPNPNFHDISLAWPASPASTCLWVIFRYGAAAHAIGDWFEVAWAKLEEGGTATPWTVPDPAAEWARCLRYCRAYKRPSGLFSVGVGHGSGANDLRLGLEHFGMRAAPALAYSGDFAVTPGSLVPTGAWQLNDATPNTSILSVPMTGVVAGTAYQLLGNNGAKIILDAEVA